MFWFTKCKDTNDIPKESHERVCMDLMHVASLVTLESIVSIYDLLIIVYLSLLLL